MVRNLDSLLHLNVLGLLVQCQEPEIINGINSYQFNNDI